MRYVVVAVLAGCATAPANPCSMATDHVAACTGEAPAFRTGGCDEQRADELLALTCEDLRDVAAVARADGWWDPFLCALEFADHCSPASNGHHTLVGTIHRLDGMPAAGVYVRVYPDGKPEAMRGSWTFAGGLFAMPELEDARHRIEVALAPTTATLYGRMLDNEPFVSLDAPIPPK